MMKCVHIIDIFNYRCRIVTNAKASDDVGLIPKILRSLAQAGTPMVLG